MSQSKLLRSRRFLPLFLTQFFGACNDNVFKNTLMLILAFSAASNLSVDSNVLLNLAAGLFILPFLLFSSIAGQITDKYEKSALVRKVKLAEIVIMLMAATALYFEAYYTLLFILFLMGCQSTLFGPVKYALLPQHLTKGELVGGNALVEMATFVAILLGTIFAGIILEFEYHREVCAAIVVIFAVIGYLTSLKVPEAPSSDPSINLDFNVVRGTFSQIRQAAEDKISFKAVIAISWFWFLGASYLTQFPNFARVVLNGDTSVVTLLLTMFSLGIGLGSLMVEHLSKTYITQALVNAGLVGLTIFGFCLYLVIPESVNQTAWKMFFSQFSLLPIIICVLGIGLFGGIFIVPLYALVQIRAKPDFRARIIAVINIVNALFMVLSAIFAMLLLGLVGVSIPTFFAILAILNIVIFWYINRNLTLP